MSLIDTFKKVIHDASTGIDGETYNPVRIIGYSSCVGAVTVFFANSIYMAFTKATFDYVGFGGGFAALMGAVAAVSVGEAVKSVGKTEPPAVPEDQKGK